MLFLLMRWCARSSTSYKTMSRFKHVRQAILLAHLFLGWKSPNSKDKSEIGEVNAFKIYYT